MQSELKEFVDLGKKHFEGKNYARAERYFVKVLRSGGRYADVLNMLGVIYHREGKFNNAIESFEEALKINPNYTEANLNLAILYNDLGEYKKSKALYERTGKRKLTSKMDPILSGKIANAHAHLGDTYRGIGKNVEAIEEYKKALALCSTFSDIRTKLGVAYRENQQKELAIKEFSEVLKDNVHYNPARLQLGITYYVAGQKPKAAKAWQEAAKRDPKNEVVQMYLRLCEEDGKKKK